MYNINDVVKVADWEDMKSLALDAWDNMKDNKKFIEYAYDYSLFNDNKDKDVCGQTGVITSILNLENATCYKINFFNDKFKKYNNYLFEEYLLKSCNPKGIENTTGIFIPKIKKYVFLNDSQMKLLSFLSKNDLMNGDIIILENCDILEL